MAAEIKAINLLKSMREGTLERKRLSRDARRTCVQYMYECENKTQWEIANELGVARSTIQDDLKHAEEAALEVYAPYETEKILKRLSHKAMVLAGMARKKGDYLSEWKIETELLDLLTRSGFVRFIPRPAQNPELSAIKANIPKYLTLTEHKLHLEFAAKANELEPMELDALRKAIETVKDPTQFMIDFVYGPGNDSVEPLGLP